MVRISDKQEFIYTFQDWEEDIENDSEIKVALKIISQYMASSDYDSAQLGQEQYEEKNRAIRQRLTYLQRVGNIDSKVTFHRICNTFFPYFVTQRVQYLLGNGVTFDDENTKKKLGSKFDYVIQEAATSAVNQGVSYLYFDHEEGQLKFFTALESLILKDEITGLPRLAIRFWQIGKKNYRYIEIYKEDGMERYKAGSDGEIIFKVQELTPYKYKEITDSLGSRGREVENLRRFAVIPLYPNSLHRSEFTPGFKSLSDAYDFIASDLADGITIIEGIYWVIQNYGGADAAGLIDELQQLKATYSETGTDSKIGSESIQIPFEAKKMAMQLYKELMYFAFMALDLKALTGGSLTNVAINVAKTDLDLAVDKFEYEISRAVIDLLDLLGIEDKEPKFKRRSISNDTETVDNISKMLDDGYVDFVYAINECPLIPDDARNELKERVVSIEYYKNQKKAGIENQNNDLKNETLKEAQ